jgi:hypothetical protein
MGNDDARVLLVSTILFILTCTIAFLKYRLRSIKKEELLRLIEDNPNFAVTQKMIVVDLRSAIALDERKKRICLVQIGEGAKRREVDYSSIISFELLKDGVTVTMAPAKRCRRLAMRLTIDDTSLPSFMINFFDHALFGNNPMYSDTVDQANHWYAIMEVISRRNNVAGSSDSRQTERLIERQVLVMRCRFCGNLTAADLTQCQSCGGRL